MVGLGVLSRLIRSIMPWRPSTTKPINTICYQPACLEFRPLTNAYRHPSCVCRLVPRDLAMPLDDVPIRVSADDELVPNISPCAALHRGCVRVSQWHRRASFLNIGRASLAHRVCGLGCMGCCTVRQARAACCVIRSCGEPALLRADACC